MASSSTTRCGRLLSSEIALGTAFGSMPRGSFWEAPRVGGLSFIGEGASAVDADMVAPEESAVFAAGEEEATSCAIELIAGSAPGAFAFCFFAFNSCFAGCLGFGLSARRAPDVVLQVGL